MPCLGDDDDCCPSRPYLLNGLTIHQLETVACAAIRKLGMVGVSPKEFFTDKSLWVEAGVRPQIVEDWWNVHEEIDYQRRQHEKAAEKLRLAKQSALDKLTAEERKALGY